MISPYSRAYTPPAPTVEVRFEVYGEDKSTELLSAFVDSGADATIVPYRYLQPLALQVDNRKHIRSQWGERRAVDIYLLDILIGDIRIPVVEVVSDRSGDELILGRNVLNYLRVVLNGLKQVTEIYEY